MDLATLQQIDSMAATAVSITLERNPHKGTYTPIRRYLASRDVQMDEWVSAEQRDAALDAEELWVAQWYPDTPVGFHLMYAHTLEALLPALDKAMRDG